MRVLVEKVSQRRVPYILALQFLTLDVRVGGSALGFYAQPTAVGRVGLAEGEAPTLKALTEAGSGSVQEKEKALWVEIITKVKDLVGVDTTEGDELVYMNSV